MTSLGFVSCSHMYVWICKLYYFLHKLHPANGRRFWNVFSKLDIVRKFCSNWTYPRSWNSVVGIRCLNIWGAQFWVFHDFARLAALLEEVSSVEDNKTLIFVETKKKVENITRSIRRYGWVFYCYAMYIWYLWYNSSHWTKTWPKYYVHQNQSWVLLGDEIIVSDAMEVCYSCCCSIM